MRSKRIWRCIDAAPQHQEATQALGDLYARMEQPDRAAVYYGLLFDLLIEPRDEIKALAIYNRFLRPAAGQQPPERIARYAFLQQKQNRFDEAIEQYSKAAEMFTEAGRRKTRCSAGSAPRSSRPKIFRASFGWPKPPSASAKTRLLPELFCATGQLASAGGAKAEALQFLGRAYKLAPQERSVALLYADATLKSGRRRASRGAARAFRGHGKRRQLSGHVSPMR